MKPNLNLSNRSILLIVAVIFCYFSCQQNNRNESLDQVVVWSKRAPSGLNPIVNVASAGSDIMSLIYLPLADYNPKTLEYEPVLAEQIPIFREYDKGANQGKPSYTFTIKEEAKWDDGQPVTVDDYIFTLKLIKNPSVNSPRFRAVMNDVIDAVKSSDGNFCTTVLNNKNIIDLQLISNFPILPEHIIDPKNTLRKISFSDLIDLERYKEIESDNEELKKMIQGFNQMGTKVEDVKGSGMYRLAEWELDQYIKLVKKDNHWTQNQESELFDAYPKTIIYDIVPDEAMAIAKFHNGQIDIMSELSSKDFEILQNDPKYSDNFTFETNRLPRYYYIGLNMRSKELQFPEVRQALGNVINVDTIIATYEQGLGKRINSPFLQVESNEDFEKFDTQKARKLLESNGWKDSDKDGVLDKMIDGEMVELNISITSTNKELGQFITTLLQQDAQKAGFNIEVDVVDNTSMRQKVRSHDFEMVLSAATQSLVPYDPYVSFHTDNLAQGKGNNFGFGNQKSDRLIEKIRNENDEESRKEYYYQLADMLAAQDPIIYLYSPMERIIYNSDLEGILSVKSPGYFPQSFRKKQ